MFDYPLFYFEFFIFFTIFIFSITFNCSDSKTRNCCEYTDDEDDEDISEELFRLRSGTDSTAMTPPKPQSSTFQNLKKNKKNQSIRSMRIKKSVVIKEKSKIMEKSKQPSTGNYIDNSPPKPKTNDPNNISPNQTSPDQPIDNNNNVEAKSPINNNNSPMFPSATVTKTDDQGSEKKEIGQNDADIMRGVGEIMAITKARKQESSKKVQLQKQEREKAEQQKKKWFTMGAKTPKK